MEQPLAPVGGTGSCEPMGSGGWPANGTLFQPITVEPGANLATLAGALLRPDVGLGSPIPEARQWTYPRPGHRGMGRLGVLRAPPRGAATLLGLALFLFASTVTDPVQFAPGSALLAVLPFLLASAAVALQQITAALIAVGAAASTRLPCGGGCPGPGDCAGPSTLAVMSQLDGVQSAAGSPTETDMARFICRWLAEHPGDQTIFVVPRLEWPAIPACACWLARQPPPERVQPLAVGRTFRPFAGQLPGTCSISYLWPRARRWICCASSIRPAQPTPNWTKPASGRSSIPWA